MTAMMTWLCYQQDAGRRHDDDTDDDWRCEAKRTCAQEDLPGKSKPAQRPAISEGWCQHNIVLSGGRRLLFPISLAAIIHPSHSKKQSTSNMQGAHAKCAKRPLTTAVVVLSTLCCTSMGFLSPIQPRRPLMAVGMAGRQAPEVNSNLKKELQYRQGLPRLTPEEERELLRQAVEMRRLTELERDLARRSPNKQIPLISVRAKEAGYGTEIDLYEAAMHDGLVARETLVTRNMGLVRHVVNGIAGNGKAPLNSLSRDDLIQEGAIGVARAVDRWNPAIGGKFSTYAVYWIRAAVLRCIAERDDVVRVPNHVTHAIRQLNKAARTLGVDIDKRTNALSSSRPWKEAEIAKRLAETAGLTDSQMSEALKARRRRYGGGYVEFQDWMSKGKQLESDTPLVNVAASDSSSLELDDIRRTLSMFLRPKELEAISLRYGLQPPKPQVAEPYDYLAQAELDLFGSIEEPQKKEIVTKGKWGEAMSFTEIGKHMHISAEYGRKLCHAAMDKLQAAAADGRLEPGYLF